jgi:hypothetical protein
MSEMFVKIRDFERTLSIARIAAAIKQHDTLSNSENMEGPQMLRNE